MRAVAVIGNPQPASRTRRAAELLAERLGAQCSSIELSDIGAGLLRWGDPTVASAKELVRAADLLVVACPTYKATYTGLLKIFLDQFDGGTGLAGQVVVPLMLGAGLSHALAPELTLKPVLVELGATCPTASLYLIDKTFESDGMMDRWVERWGPVVARNVSSS